MLHTPLVDEMVEIAALGRLKAAYVRFVDTKRWADLRGLLTDDFTYWRVLADESGPPPPAHTGADAFVAALRSSFATAVTVHQAYLPELTLIDRGTATGVWAMSDWVDGAAGVPSFRGYGHYHEEYAKGADGLWRLRRMRLTRLRIDLLPATDPDGLAATVRAWARGWSDLEA